MRATIEKSYADYARRWNTTRTVFPFGDKPTDDGTPHLETSPAHASLVVTDRGKEISRQTTNSIDEILYWIFSAQAYEKAWAFEIQNRTADKDSRRIVFPKAVEEIGKLSPSWAQKMKLEQEKILKTHPFYR